MSSILSSQGVVLATAMAAVSGTAILLAIRLQKSLPSAEFSISTQSCQSPLLRSCISSADGKKRLKKKKKKVQFAEDVVDPTGNSEEYRRLHSNRSHYYYEHDRSNEAFPEYDSDSLTSENSYGKGQGHRESIGGRMPANRIALYNGILRDRVVHRRAAYSC